MRFQGLPLEKIPNLVDVVKALEDAKGDAQGEVTIEALVSAHNPEGLDEGLLELNVREIISQYGLDATWEED